MILLLQLQMQIHDLGSSSNNISILSTNWNSNDGTVNFIGNRNSERSTSINDNNKHGVDNIDTERSINEKSHVYRILLFLFDHVQDVNLHVF